MTERQPLDIEGMIARTGKLIAFTSGGLLEGGEGLTALLSFLSNELTTIEVQRVTQKVCNVGQHSSAVSRLGGHGV